METIKFRQVSFYKRDFEEFFARQDGKVKEKIKLIILLNGFQKKTQKTPWKEITRALKMKKEYYEEKKQPKKP